ncbi:MAG: hypothetical protein Q4Q53_04520 [Methanocorpusculum sp.]|nr:hypothetical protein [Methanocorpusculum sp.]
MALKSLADTFRLLVITPYVWISGVFACLAILLAYIIYLQFGLVFAVPVAVITIFLIPAFFAGTYGVILENHGSPSVYLKYVKFGYIRCLLPTIFVFVIGLIATGAIVYVLIHLGFDMGVYVYVAMLVALPFLFFFYFADMAALIGARGIFNSLRESTLRVMMGSFSITVFYLVNILVFFLMNFVFSAIISFYAMGSMDFLMNLSDAEIISMGQDELMALAQTSMDTFFASQTAVTASLIAVSVCALFFIPFFSTYKACFFKRLITTVPAAIKKIEEDGEYDSKGRWFKYK